MFKFLQQFLMAPTVIGSLIPSSKRLARQVVELALMNYKPTQMVVEIGPGLGPITQELKRALNVNTKIHLIEKNETFIELLKHKFPDDHHYPQGFEEIELWRSNPSTAKIIISSLPWFSMPKSIVETGTNLLTRELLNNPESLIVQYTYFFFSPIPFRHPEIERIPIKIVFGNWPPARIWVYKRRNLG